MLESDVGDINPLSAKPTKWSNTLLAMNCLNVFDHFVGLALKGLRILFQGGWLTWDTHHQAILHLRQLKSN